MNPRCQPLERARLEGHRLPDRQDRRQARRRLHARRDPERHHQGHAGQLRAHHRLRRHQGAAVGVREVPRHQGRARHPDAVGGRGHGHRPHLPRVAAEGPAVARARPQRPELRPRRGRDRRAGRSTSWWPAPSIGTPDRPFQLEAALRRGVSVDDLAAATASTRGSSTRSASSPRSVPTSPRSASRHDPGRLAAGQAPRVRRRAARVALGRRRGRRARGPHSQPGSRVSTRPSTPVAPSSTPTRRTTTPPTRTTTRCAPATGRRC